MTASEDEAGQRPVVTVRCEDVEALGTAVAAVRAALPRARVVGVLGDEALETEVRADLFRIGPKTPSTAAPDDR